MPQTVSNSSSKSNSARVVLHDINKNLVNKVPEIEESMQHSLTQMNAQAGEKAKHPAKHSHIRPLALLQEKIAQIDEQLDIAMKSAFEIIPEAKQNELKNCFRPTTQRGQTSSRPTPH